MNKILKRLIVSAVLVSTCSYHIRAQDSHVQSRYVKSTNTTVVTSDVLYVVNMPTQFVAIQLSSRYPGQGQPGSAPEHILIEFDSYSAAPRYQKDAARRLAVKADEEVIDFGELGYNVFRQSGKDTYSSENGSLLGLHTTTMPPDALVRSTGGGNGLYLETMFASNVPLYRLAKLAKAQKVLMRIGDTVFALSPTHLAILREFVSANTPAGGAYAAEASSANAAVPPDVPSDANNASLDVTLNWLKKEISREGTTTWAGIPRQIEADDFSGCRIRYKIIPKLNRVPGASNLVYAIAEFQFSLADINPEAVRAADLKDFSSVFLQTHNNEPKIKITNRSNDGGIAGRTIDERMDSGTIIYLRAGTASSVRAALLHAIWLCQPKP